MNYVKTTIFIFILVLLSYYTQAQSEADLVGDYSNGIEMGGSTLTLNSDGTYEI